jgi:hypothetical protein
MTARTAGCSISSLSPTSSIFDQTTRLRCSKNGGMNRHVM